MRLRSGDSTILPMNPDIILFLLKFWHTAAAFIIVVSVIVFVHEFGHYWVARRCGVRVEAFSIGFGKELFGWKDKAGTNWKIALLPLGGYVKMFGDSSEASTPDKEKIEAMSEADKKEAFHFKPLYQKALIVAAGPLINFLFAILVFFLIFTIAGKPDLSNMQPVVGEVIKGSAAEKAGIMKGDVLTRVRGMEIKSFPDIKEAVAMNPGEEMEVVLKRGQEKVVLRVTPRLEEASDPFGNKVKVGLLGIKAPEFDFSKVKYERYGPMRALTAAVAETYRVCENTTKALWQIIIGVRGTEDLGGPLRIAKYSGQASEQGFLGFFYLLALISANLGFVNLFPIPLLDGGHLMYYSVEALRGKPMAEKFQQYGYYAGGFVLAFLMIFSLFNDIRFF